jgi:hypothetical protein
VLASGRVSFDAERTKKGHADRFWAVALACQKERQALSAPVEIGVRVLGDVPSVRPAIVVEIDDTPLLVELVSVEAEAYQAAATTIATLGGELLRPMPGGAIEREGLFIVRPVARPAGFLRWALLQQGCVRRVVES